MRELKDIPGIGNHDVWVAGSDSENEVGSNHGGHNCMQNWKEREDMAFSRISLLLQEASITEFNSFQSTQFHVKLAE